MTNIDKYVGLQVKKKRAAIGLNQEQVADILGLTRVSVTNLETGRAGFTIKSLYILCCLFNCDPSELMPKIQKMEIDPTMKVRTITVKRIVKKRVVKSNVKQILKNLSQLTS